MIYTLGIDIGSTTSKCILMSDGKEIIAKSIYRAGAGTGGAEHAFNDILVKSNISRSDIDYIVATGYGRTIFEAADHQLSELSCHAKGVFSQFPEVRTIIDIGGQDAKVINLNKNGIIDSFLMNDKCAAGTGRFLEVMSKILQIDISEMEEYAAESDQPIQISNTCTVFAESEVISQLAKGEATSDIVAGICSSVAGRVASLAKRGKVHSKTYMSGGVARNAGVRNALSKVLETEIIYSKHSQYMGAMGAAIAGFEMWNKNVNKEVCYSERS